MKLEKLLQQIDNEVPILISFYYPITIGEISYKEKQVYYSGKLGDMSYSFLRAIQNFKVQKISFEEYGHDTKISIII